MKTLKYIFAVLFVSVLFVSCSSDDDADLIEPNPVEGLHKIYEFSQTDHSIEVYSEKQNLEVGYNELSIRIKNKATDIYITNASPSWTPMMHMETRDHSAPRSMLKNSENNTVYKGHIVFQMAGNETEYWDLTLNYTFNGQALSETNRIDVRQPSSALKKSHVFMGSDEVRYILAYVGPKNPEVAINDITAVLYKMEDMMSFPVVENYTITLDPRMPGMGNHSSPNNEALRYDAATKMYKGKLSLTMTGYWKLNLKLNNADGETVKGEDVTDSNPESSLFFEIEF